MSQPPSDIDEQAALWVARLQSADASAADRAACERWCAQHPAHRVAYDCLRGLWGDMGAVPLPEGHLRSLRRRQDRRLVAQGAGGALLGLAVLAVAVLQGPRWLDRWQADYLTEVGQVVQVTLPDGSRATLNSDTALRLDFSAGARRVEVLRGEAFFEVEHDPVHPFIASDDRLTARAVGTRYGLRHGDGTEGSDVTVEQGRVAVGLMGANDGDIELTAGQQAVTPRADQPSSHIVVQTVDAGRETSWRQGVLVFSHRPLRAVLDDLGRYRRGKIVLLDDEMGALPVSGVFDLHDVDGALASIAQRLPVRVTVLADRLVLVRAR